MNTSMFEQRLASIFAAERKEKAASARKLEAELDRFDQLTAKLSAEGNQESMSCEG